jgi:hypothetical protein
LQEEFFKMLKEWAKWCKCRLFVGQDGSEEAVFGDRLVGGWWCRCGSRLGGREDKEVAFGFGFAQEGHFF